MATLTDTRIRNLKPGKTVKEVADPSSAGLRLRVTPTGKKVWFYRYRDTDSNLQKITLGHYRSRTRRLPSLQRLHATRQKTRRPPSPMQMPHL